MATGRRQFLWINPKGADVYYPAASNVAVNTGDKGSVAWWQYAWQTHDAAFRWRIPIDADNYMRVGGGRRFMVRGGGSSKTVLASVDVAVAGWELVVATWDFTGGVGASELKVYLNGAQSGTTITDASPLVGTPDKIYVGPDTTIDNTGEQRLGDQYLQWIGIWDDCMAEAQALALYEDGFHYRPLEGDGEGTLTLLARFDGQLDAQIAAGSGTFAIDNAVAHGDDYVLFEDGTTLVGKRVFGIGTPDHDGEETDPKPLHGVLVPERSVNRDGKYTVTNYADYGVAEIATGMMTDAWNLGFDPPGQPLCGGDRELYPGSILRQLVHIPNDNTPGMRMRLGPVDYVHYPTWAPSVYGDWGSGVHCAVVADAGNSTTQVKTDLPGTMADAYWAGAYITFLGGDMAGRRVLVTGYTQGMRILSWGEILTGIPSVGDVAVVDFPARLQGVQSEGLHGTTLPRYNMSARLWEFHSGVAAYTKLDFLYWGQVQNYDWKFANLLMYEGGRVVQMDGLPDWQAHGRGLFGRPGGQGPAGGTFEAEMRFRRFEVVAPSTYQVLRRNEAGEGPWLGDTFMLEDKFTEESTKVWRQKGLARTTAGPTKNTDGAAAKAALESAGTWRETAVYSPVAVEYDVATETQTCLLVGENAAGVQQLGYIEGTWVGGTLAWTDATPPAGASNPFLTLAELLPWDTDNVAPGYAYPMCIAQDALGVWFLVYQCQVSHPDRFKTYAWYGAETKWAFNRAEHWFEGNPIGDVAGGMDSLDPDGSGHGLAMNRDCPMEMVANVRAVDPNKRFMGFGRGKALLNSAYDYEESVRPGIGLVGPDPRSLRPLANRAGLVAGVLLHGAGVAMLYQPDVFFVGNDTGEGFTMGISTYVTEDGVTLQAFRGENNWIPQGELVGEPSRLHPATPSMFRVGDRPIYYYSDNLSAAANWINFAYFDRYGGEAYYALAGGETAGLLETPLIERPSRWAEWPPLILNADPQDGTLTVEVLSEDEVVLTGFATGDCATVTDSTEQGVVWDGDALAGVTATTIRLRFNLTRPGGGDSSPVLYSWEIDDGEIAAPVVSDLQVNGEAAPAYVHDATPDLSWTYTDAAGYVQSAYRILVATSQALLDGGTGDMWDSGVVSGAGTTAAYAGSALSNDSAYYWEVRCRNAPGVWGEAESVFVTAKVASSGLPLCRVYYDCAQVEGGAVTGAGNATLDVVNVFERATGDTIIYGDGVGPASTNVDGYVYVDVPQGTRLALEATWPGGRTGIRTAYTELTVPSQAMYDVGADFQP